jgi:nucleotide-binding universal stress UspA family protein
VVLLVGVPTELREDGEPQVEDMVAHLKRHAVAAEVVRLKLGGDDTGKLLLAKTKELRADIVVMGAFHHSKWRQFILGGVTLTMLEEATIPLFMAH